jgi:hypothetical protein
MANRAKVRKCLICGVRPSNGQSYCQYCTAQIEAEKRRKQEPRAFRYATYDGTTIEFHAVGKGVFKARYCGRNPDTLPQKLLINLDKWCDGFTRDQVKKLKRQVLSFAK